MRLPHRGPRRVDGKSGRARYTHARRARCPGAQASSSFARRRPAVELACRDRAFGPHVASRPPGRAARALAYRAVPGSSRLARRATSRSSRTPARTPARSPTHRPVRSHPRCPRSRPSRSASRAARALSHRAVRCGPRSVARVARRSARPVRLAPDAPSHRAISSRRGAGRWTAAHHSTPTPRRVSRFRHGRRLHPPRGPSTPRARIARRGHRPSTAVVAGALPFPDRSGRAGAAPPGQHPPAADAAGRAAFRSAPRAGRRYGGIGGQSEDAIGSFQRGALRRLTLGAGA
jgi:hypothetical protein